MIEHGGALTPPPFPSRCCRRSLADHKRFGQDQNSSRSRRLSPAFAKLLQPESFCVILLRAINRHFVASSWNSVEASDYARPFSRQKTARLAAFDACAAAVRRRDRLHSEAVLFLHPFYFHDSFIDIIGQSARARRMHLPQTSRRENGSLASRDRSHGRCENQRRETRQDRRRAA